MAVLECLPAQCVGIDVAKATLAVCAGPDQPVRTVPNTRRAVRALLANLPPATLIVCEPTGGHEALLLGEACAAGIACHRADTLKVKAFARSYGRHAKTDAIDARLLAAYATERWHSLALHGPAAKTQVELVALVARRNDIMAMRIAELNRAKAPGHRLIVSSCKKTVAMFDRQLEQLDAALAQLCARSRVLARRIAVCQTLAGVGPRTAIALAAAMPELGTMTRKQAAALAGLAPHPNDSGTIKGYRRTRGGRPQVRTILFMAALGAARAEGPLRPFFQRLVANGKKKLVALSAVMRKIVVILNARLRDEFAAMS